MTRGVVIFEREGLGLATVHARKGAREALEQRVRERFGVELPPGLRRHVAGDVALMATAPNAWLASHEHSGNAFASSLAAALTPLASVTDQTDAYAVFRLSGPEVRTTLARLFSIDLHPRTFQVNDAAVTPAARHIGATLWRLADASDGSAVFEIAVFRSLAASFLTLLNE